MAEVQVSDVMTPHLGPHPNAKEPAVLPLVANMVHILHAALHLPNLEIGATAAPPLRIGEGDFQGVVALEEDLLVGAVVIAVEKTAAAPIYRGWTGTDPGHLCAAEDIIYHQTVALRRRVATLSATGVLATYPALYLDILPARGDLHITNMYQVTRE